MHSDKGVREEIHTQSVSFWHLFLFQMRQKESNQMRIIFQGMGCRSCEGA